MGARLSATEAIAAHREYREAGYHPISVRLKAITDDRGARKKKPSFPGGTWATAAAADPEQAVRQGYTDLALLCDNVAAFDFDPREGESPVDVEKRVRAFLRQYALKGTVVEQTGDGFHVLTRLPPNPPEQGWSKRKLGAPHLADEVQVDTTGSSAGSLLFVAPSYHPVEQRRYKRRTPLHPVSALPECPRELLDTPAPEAAKAGPRRQSTAVNDGTRFTGDFKTLDVVALFRTANLYREPLADKKHSVVCPWEDQHTSGSDGTDTAVWEAGSLGEVPGFRCLHAHCEGRTMKDVRETFGPELVDRHCSETFQPVPQPGVAGHSGTDSSRRSTGENLTDMGNARRLVARHGADLRYVPAWGIWLVYDGRRWGKDETGEVERRAKDTVRSIYAEALATQDSDKRQALAKHAAKSESEHAVRAMIALAKTEPGIPATPAELDADPWLFNVQNGTVNLRTGALQPHRHENLITKLSPAAYDAGAKCPVWLAFLDRIMASRVDLVGFLQRLIGYTLTGQTSEQVLALLYGTGANGKSTLQEVIAELAGDYGQSIEFSTLLARGQDSTRNDLARLVGARYVAGSEVEDGRRFSEVLVKQLTGGDKITARFLFKEYFDFRPQFKLWLAANHKPVIRGTDLAIWRRIRLVPCTVTIPEAERDPALRDKLRAELSGILAWSVRGCLAWQRDGLGLPEAVREATNEYREEMDVLGGFLSEHCNVGPGLTARAGELYEAYKGWCDTSGEHAKSKNKFATMLTDRGFEKSRDRGGAAYTGLALVTTVTARDDFSGNFSKDVSHIESIPTSRNKSSQSSQKPDIGHTSPSEAPLDRAAGDYIRL